MQVTLVLRADSTLVAMNFPGPFLEVRLLSSFTPRPFITR